MKPTKEFFNVTELQDVFTYLSDFSPVEHERIEIGKAYERILAENVTSDVNLPDFPRSTMDGYAVSAQSTFGASEANPAYLMLKGTVGMGESPDFSVEPGQAAKISTGGMLPQGADSVVMIEHAEVIDDTTIEVYRSAAPGQHAIEIGEDFRKDEVILNRGIRLRPQEIGLLAAFGKETVSVYKKPVISIISTGDEIIPIHQTPGPGQIRDINTHTLTGLVRKTGSIPVALGIVQDDYDALYEVCSKALSESDMVLLSGGSSVGTRDFTIEVLSSLPDTNIFVHGISISPGKPTILSKSGKTAFWGLPGHVVSAMVVFEIVVKPFIEHISGYHSVSDKASRQTAYLSRNISSAQGRIDFIRVKLIEKDGVRRAEPILGKSGLIHTMIKADGLIEIGMNTEGLDEGAEVTIIPI